MKTYIGKVISKVINRPVEYGELVYCRESIVTMMQHDPFNFSNTNKKEKVQIKKPSGTINNVYRYELHELCVDFVNDDQTTNKLIPLKKGQYEILNKINVINSDLKVKWFLDYDGNNDLMAEVKLPDFNYAEVINLCNKAIDDHIQSKHINPDILSDIKEKWLKENIHKNIWI